MELGLGLGLGLVVRAGAGAEGGAGAGGWGVGLVVRVGAWGCKLAPEHRMPLSMKHAHSMHEAVSLLHLRPTTHYSLLSTHYQVSELVAESQLYPAAAGREEDFAPATELRG